LALANQVWELQVDLQLVDLVLLLFLRRLMKVRVVDYCCFRWVVAIKACHQQAITE